VNECDLRKVDVEELHSQFIEAFRGADYPLTDPYGLLPALPQGPGTKFESNGVRFTVLELQNLGQDELNIDTAPEFPYDDPEALADDICQSLRRAKEDLNERSY